MTTRYVRWEKAGGKEFSLGANFLTNQHLCWMAAARTQYSKFQPGAPEIVYPLHRLNNEYFHVIFNMGNQKLSEILSLLLISKNDNNLLNFIMRFFNIYLIKEIS